MVNFYYFSDLQVPLSLIFYHKHVQRRAHRLVLNHNTFIRKKVRE